MMMILILRSQNRCAAHVWLHHDGLTVLLLEGVDVHIIISTSDDPCSVYYKHLLE